MVSQVHTIPRRARGLPPALRTLPQAHNRRDALIEMLSAAIAEDALPVELPLPSCRTLAIAHGLSKNTVQAAYDRLVDIGLVTAKAKSGYFVAAARRAEPFGTSGLSVRSTLILPAPLPSTMPRVRHPENWQTSRFPFVYNQIDPSLFPIEAWRECSRLALARKGLNALTADDEAGDNPHLIVQLRKRLLAHRGIAVTDSDIMVTLGTQNAIALTGMMMRAVPGTIAIEDPGYPDARNAFAMTGNVVVPVPVDAEGLIVDLIPRDCKLVHVTPSHQFPTSVTMSLARRRQLLDLAEAQGFMVLEDDYEADLEPENAAPTLRSLDRYGRVIYASSLSKTLSPGLRLGFMVAPPDIMVEAKALRHAVLRHAPTQLQETAALFIGLGHYDAHLRRLSQEMARRRGAMAAGIAEHLPMLRTGSGSAGSSFWLQGKDGFDSEALAARLLSEGVVFDPGRIFFADSSRTEFLRLGFAAIDPGKIDEGLRRIAAAM
jgi:GntR family transcriptional regulator / MocR family aminotransferase